MCYGLGGIYNHGVYSLYSVENPSMSQTILNRTLYKRGKEEKPNTHLLSHIYWGPFEITRVLSPESVYGVTWMEIVATGEIIKNIWSYI